MNKAIITTVAIVTIGILEVCAITQGINGAGLAGATAVIAGLAGWQATRRANKPKS